MITRLVFNMNRRFSLILGLFGGFTALLDRLGFDLSGAICLFSRILLGPFWGCLSLLWSWLFTVAISGIWFGFDTTPLLWRWLARAGILTFSSGLRFLQRL